MVLALSFYPEEFGCDAIEAILSIMMLLRRFIPS
jgi:hypothetical protein